MSKGWFSTPGRPGDRSIEQQLVGLDALLSTVRGRSVLDVGCAEGLIALKLRAAGAASVHGVESVPEHLEVARRLAGKDPAVTFELADVNVWTPPAEPRYDVVLMLAILHKLQDPSAAARRLVAVAADQVVIRLPPSGAVVIDARSGRVPHDIGAVLSDCGFEFEEACSGTFGEWIGFYRRRKAAMDATEPTKQEPTQREEQTGDETPSVDRPSDAVEHPEVQGQGGDATALPPPEPEKTEPTGGSGHELFPESARRQRARRKGTEPEGH